jgi:hypothetical protein
MHCVGQRGLRFASFWKVPAAHKSVLTSVTTNAIYGRDEHEQRKPFDDIVFPQRQSDRPPTPRCIAIQYSYKQNALDESSKLTMKGIE